MDVLEYAGARRTNLVRAAILLGCPPDEAPALVDRVVTEQWRPIERAEDPDPIVLAALRRAVPGGTETAFGNASPAAQTDELMLAEDLDVLPGPRLVKPRRDQRPLLAGVVIALLVVALVAFITRPVEPDRVPSLFGYDAAGARALLTSQGLEVVERQTRACELAGRVVSSEPAEGVEVSEGETVLINTASPSDAFCMGRYSYRLEAWEFVDFAMDRGPEPEFRGSPRIYVDGVRSSLATVLDAVAEAGRGSEAELVVDTGVPAQSACGIDRPATLGERPALSLRIEVAQSGIYRCPVTVDLYRTDATIDTIVLHTARSPGDPVP